MPTFLKRWSVSCKTRVLLLVVVLCLALLLWPQALASLRWERQAIAHGEWWRLLSCHLVHLSPSHAGFNLLGLFVLFELLGEVLAWQDWLSLALVSALGLSLGLLLLSPSVEWYAGLSGLLHGLWAGAALSAWLRTRKRWWALVLLGLLLKLAWPVAVVVGLPVLTESHGYGALAGVLWALMNWFYKRSAIFD